jgi:KDO2-lipid IV(A) lauroyltransferase
MAAILRLLPFTLAASLGRGLTLLLHRLDRRHRERVRDQMLASLGPDLGREEAERLTREMYRHYGTMLAEFVRLPDLSLEDVERMVEVGDADQVIIPALQQGRGMVFATGHIGNWELAGVAFTLRGYVVGAVARPLDNPLLDRYVRGVRTASGQAIWEKFGALKKVVRVLREGKGFGILVDQDAGSKGVFVPFFGRSASTISTPVDLALLLGSPIVAAGVHRLGGERRYVFRHGPVRWPDPAADREAERVRLLTLINQDLEGIIRQAPEQWLWLHRRWKTRPPEERRTTRASGGETTALPVAEGTR